MMMEYDSKIEEVINGFSCDDEMEVDVFLRVILLLIFLFGLELSI